MAVKRVAVLPNRWTSTGIKSLDFITGGGLPRGAITELFGPCGVGKSTICLYSLASAQMAGCSTCLVDVDNSYDTHRARTILDESEIGYVRPGKSQLWQYASDLLRLDLLVVDGINCLFEDVPLTDDQMLGHHLNAMFPFFAETVAASNCSVLITNHISFRGNMLRTPGGAEIKRACDIRLQMSKTGLTHTRSGLVDGISVEISCIKNKLAMPLKEAYINIRRGYIEDCGFAEWDRFIR